jgi:hypothetical protein
MSCPGKGVVLEGAPESRRKSSLEWRGYDRF